MLAMDVREQIVVAATKLFAAGGFEATSLQTIAKQVGIRRQSLLYHFPSKDELRRSVLETMLSHWKDRLPRLLQATTSGEDLFDSVVHELVDFFLVDPDRARLLMREVLDRPKEVRAMVASLTKPWVNIVCNYIRKGQTQGRVYEDLDPEAYMIHIVNLVLAGVATYQSLGTLLPKDKNTSGSKITPRYTEELLRIAKYSLFQNKTSLSEKE